MRSLYITLIKVDKVRGKKKADCTRMMINISNVTT